jgi:hypothetical protein
MPMIPAPQPGTLRGELYGLKVNLLAAVTGITSGTTGLTIATPTVRNRDYTALFDGPWPLLTIRYAQYRMELIAAGKPPVVGQSPAKPNLYSIELETVVAAKSAPSSEVVSAAQDDLIDLCDAMVTYFNHYPNRCLPTTYGAMAKYAGIPIQFRGVPPFVEREGGEVRVVFEGVIGVLGIAQTGLAV